MIKRKVMVNFIGLMVEFIKVTGKMENRMERESIREAIKCKEKVNG